MFLALAGGCHKTRSLPSIKISGDLRTELRLTKWQILGPFAYPRDHLLASDINKHVGLNQPFLAAFGLEETSLTARQFAEIRRLSSSATPALVKNFQYEQEGPLLNLAKLFENDSYAVAYAAVEIDSSKAQVVGLDVSSDKGVKAWINGTLIIATPPDTYGACWPNQHIERLPLQPGRNFLMFKVDQKERSDWALRASLLPLADARVLSAKQNLPILRNAIIAAGVRLEPMLNLYQEPVPARVRILGSNGNILSTDNYVTNSAWTKQLTGIKPGLYRCEITTQYETRQAPCYLGSSSGAEAIARSQISHLTRVSSAARGHLKGWLERLTYLNEPQHKKESDFIWQNKIIFLLSEIDAAVKQLRTGHQSFLHNPGFHIRAFRSNIDGQYQYYGLHVPHRTASVSHYPIVLMTGSWTDSKYPFLRGLWLVDSLWVQETQAVAEKYGVIIVRPHGRSDPRGLPVQEADYIEVLKDVEKYFRVDRRRIFLMGYCQGGHEALLMAAHHPSLFAGVATYALGNPQVLSQSDLSSAWGEDYQPVKLLPNLKKIPILLMHGRNDQESPLQNSAAFFDSCKTAGVKCTFEIDPYGLHNVGGEIMPEERAAQFFTSIINISKPVSVSINTSQLKYGSAYWVKMIALEHPGQTAQLNAEIKPDNKITVQTENVKEYAIAVADLPISPNINTTIITDGKISYSGPLRQKQIIPIYVNSISVNQSEKNPSTEGPIADFFAKPFLVIEGTIGDRVSSSSNERLVHALRNSWKNYFFCDLRIKLDRNVTAKDRSKYSLLLVGNAENNKLWKDMSGSIPLTYSRTELSIGNKTFKGHNLSFESIFPNPFSRNQYVLLIGSNSSERWDFPDLTPWLNGKYDYIVYEHQDSSPTEIGHGLLNNKWR